MAMRGAVIEKLFTCGAGWFEGSSSSSSCNSPTSPLDLKFVMSPRRVHNSSCDEVVSSRGIGLGIIVNMDKSRESTAILLRPSHHVNANTDDEEEYTIVTRHDHHKRNKNNSYSRKELVYGHNCGDEKLRSLFDISPTPARVDDIKAGAHFLSTCHECNKQLDGKDIYMYRGEKAFCSIECRSLEIAKMEEESMKKKMMMRSKYDCCSSSSTRNSPQQVPVSRSSGHGHGQMMSTGGIFAI